MFGYVKIFKPELKIKDYEIYKGIYCSLCKALGKNYGLTSRLSLNYDFTFLALVRMAVNDEFSGFTPSHCSFNIAKKCLACPKEQEDINYSSAVSAIVVFHKIKDNITDNSFFKKLPFIFIYPFSFFSYKKATKKYFHLAQVLDEQMKNQRDLEKNKCTSIDKAADPTAKALSEIISHGFENDEKKIMTYFGYCLGRLLYILDAVDDLEDDLKSKGYNTFLLQNEEIPEIRKQAEMIINTTMDEIAKAYELLEINRCKDILDNIIYYGFDKTIDKVLKKEGCKNEKSI